ncbi:MAG: hypothetical protein KAR11_00130 [Phycisphaerae bacterium]|nr:hypothetical protein [Phycisphaerae bacterium]
MKILGIHANTYESGCCLVVDGQLRHAVSQERLDRRKMSRSRPIEAIETMLGTEGIEPSQIDVLAISDDIGFRGYQQSRRAMKKSLLCETLPAARKHYGLSLLKLLRFYWRHRFGKSLQFSHKRQVQMDRVKAHLHKRGFKGKVESYEHGFSHAASGYYPSGFDDALIFVMEGSSFINASSVYLGKAGRVEKILDIPMTHSAGKFYSTITRLLGFVPNRHEGKITGLAAMGDSSVARPLVSKLFYLKDDADDFYVDPRIHLWWWDYRGESPKRLPPELRAYSREDLAAAWQEAMENAVVGLVRRFLGRYPGIRNVALAGGVHGNVKLNQRINELDEVDEIYVHPGMGDCGQPVGAALAGWAKNTQTSRAFRHDDVYLGPGLDAAEILQLTEQYELVFEDAEDLPDRVAELLADNKVVAICRGRMEYGPRALGNRSILYSPTDASVNDWLNQQLKRTEFMPFAPVTLIEEIDKCYINAHKSQYAAGFMTICYNCTEFMKRTQPAVVHVDSTARPQYISRHQNPFYYDIVARFRDRTGLPSLVNTSFNMHEEPIVCTPTEALQAFVASNLDALVLEDELLLRDSNSTLLNKMIR